MLKPVYVILLLLFFSTIKVFAQDPETDSLIRLLSKAPEDTNKVHLYWQTARSLVYQDPLKAIPYSKSGIALSEKLGFISGLEKCNNITSLAFSFNAKYDSALVYINKAVMYALKAGNIKRLSLAYLNRADVFTNLQNYPAALKDCDTAVIYAEQIKNYDALGRIYSIMTGIYRSLQQYEQALTALDKSNIFFGLSKNRQMIAMNYSERADILLFLNQPETAINWYKKAIVIADSLEDINNLSAYYGAMGEAYVKLKNYKEAEKAILAALNYAKQTENTGQQAVCYTNLSSLELEQNHFQKSIDYGLKAYELIKPETDLLREQIIANTLTNAYLKNGNTTKAYEFLEISNALKDSLVKQQFSVETAKQQAAFDVKEKEREITVLNKNKELQQQRLQKQRLLSLAAIWLLMNRNKLKQRMKELELRNQIAADLHDEVGSSLSSIHMLSQMATKQGNETTHQQILERMSNNTQETMDKMSDIVWMIKPGETEAASLKQRMERFAYEIGSTKNIEMQLNLQELELVKLNMEQRKNIWLIFKEAVNNAVKYSGTVKMEISALLQNKELTVLLKDFGKGFDSNSIKKGNGLDNMQHRAKELMATLTTESLINTGTTIKLAMPV
jgi:two-component system, NarL family, sensor histidine kinase UhpB